MVRPARGEPTGQARAPATRLARQPQRLPPPSWLFPDPETADEDGVVGVGADLAPRTLAYAYRAGVFPWPHPSMPLPWFSPDPRGVLTVDSLHVSRSLRRTLRRSGWWTTVDVAFPAVVAACAEQRSDADEGTWITPGMERAYTRLHVLGWAHSVEVWDDHALVGGVYGVQIGGCFTGESMFHRESDASKVALVDLAHRFAEVGGRMIDVQLTTPHLRGMGARDVPRSRFLRDLKAVRDLDVRLPIDERPVSRLVTASGR